MLIEMTAAEVMQFWPQFEHLFHDFPGDPQVELLPFTGSGDMIVIAHTTDDEAETLYGLTILGLAQRGRPMRLHWEVYYGTYMPEVEMAQLAKDFEWIARRAKAYGAISLVYQDPPEIVAEAFTRLGAKLEPVSYQLEG